MERSAEDKDGWLCKNTDIISVLYNQYNNFPVTEQIYTWMWKWIYNMTEAGQDGWLKRYWNVANQYYMFKLKDSDNFELRERFMEFHIMVCVLLFSKERYKVLNHVFTFTNTYPPQYPLVPSTFNDIFQTYIELSVKNQRMYLMKYSMDEIFIGADEEHKIEGLLTDYLALLLVRLYTVNDYNVTHSNPLAMPETDNTIENNDYKIFLINNLKNHLNRLSEKRIKSCLFDYEFKIKAFKLLDEYKQKCTYVNDELEKNAKVSDQKKLAIRNDLINASYQIALSLPMCDKVVDENDWHKLMAYQQITLDKCQILDCYRDISSNIGKTMIKALHIQMQHLYGKHFLLNSATISLVAPYCDLEQILKRLSLTSNYSLLMIGISSSLFDEVKGFIRKENKIYYDKSCVYDVPYNNNPAILIMKNDNVPCCSFKEIPYGELEKDEQEIDPFNHLYSNIDSISKENLTLSVKQCLGVFNPFPLRYFRLRIAYQLESDDRILSRIKPINHYLP